MIKKIWNNILSNLLYEYNKSIEKNYMIIDMVPNTVTLSLITRTNVINNRKYVFYKGRWCRLIEHKTKRLLGKTLKKQNYNIILV